MSDIYQDFHNLHSEMNSINDVLNAISYGDTNECLARVKRAFELRLANLEHSLESEKILSKSVFYTGDVNAIAEFETDVNRMRQIVLTLNSLG